MTRLAQRHKDHEAASRTATAVVLAATLVFLGVFGWLGLRQFWLFQQQAFDLGIFTQGTWLISRFEAPFFVTIRGLPLFADHSSYILFLLAPFAWVFPTAQLLIITNVVALAVTAPLAFVVARRAGAGDLLASITAVSVLLYPAVQWNVRDSFHPEVIVIPLAVGAIALLQRNRDVWAIALVLVALTAKEDVGMLIVPLGLVVAWVMGKRRTGVTIAALGAIAFLVNFLVLLPAWSPSGELLYSYRYAALGEGPIGILGGLMTQPDGWWDTFSDPLRLEYVALLVFAMPLALLSPRWLVVGIPTLLANVFSTHGYQYDVKYHYTAYLIAAVVIAAAFGAGKVERWKRPGGTATAAVVMVASGLLVWAVAAPITGWAAATETQQQVRSVLAEVPPDAAVSVWGNLVPPLAERTIVYQFPNPFVAHYYATGGPYGLLGGDVPSRGDVEWVVLRSDSHGDFDALMEELEASSEFEVVLEDEPFLLLHRR